MKFLITGGAGFIGSSLAELCEKLGHEVLVLDALTYAGHRRNLTGLRDSQASFAYGHVQNKILVAQLLRHFRPNAVFNLAAESHVDRSIAGPEAFVQTNVVGTATLLEECTRWWESEDKPEFKFVQVSTDEVYGALALEHGRFSEMSQLQPNSPYSASKAAADLFVRSWTHTFGLPTVTTRCSNNYGPRQHPEKLIPRMIINALGEKPLPVYGTGKNVRDWIHVEDHCRGILLAWEKGKTGEIYLFGGNCERKNIDIVTAICDIMDSKCPTKTSHHNLIKFVEDRKGHDLRYAVNSQKAELDLGFRREFTNFEMGLENTVEWYLNNFEWCNAIIARE